MPAPWIRAHPLAVALSCLTVGACRDTGLTTPSANAELSGDIGGTIRDEVESALGALTLSTTVTPMGATQTPGGFAIPCVNPSTAADTDGDGVPDDATFVFTAPPCHFEGWRGGTLEIVGQLRIKDPVPTDAGFGYDATLSGLRTRFTDAASQIYDVERDGARVLSGSVAGLLLTTDLRVGRSYIGKPDGRMNQQWTVTYTPATQLLINGPLNSGSLDIAGTLDWARGNDSLALTITTPTPLQYDADCTDTVQRIKSGELHAAGVFNDMDGFVRVRWTGCGNEPSYSFGS